MGNRLTKIYTRTGDRGTTGLGDGSRVDKDSLRVEAYGTVDEANSAIGVILGGDNVPEAVHNCLTEVQHDLFELGGELCIPGHSAITQDFIDRLEHDLDGFNADLPRLKEMPVPSQFGGTVPLGELGDFYRIEQEKVIYHKDLRAVEYVTGETQGRLGAPIYGKLDTDLAAAMMSINAAKGVAIGAGFASVSQLGTEHRDQMTPDGFLTNNAGGILGGISSGQDVLVRVAFKPTSSIRLGGQTVDVGGQSTDVITKGRHDPCVGIRAVPIAEAMLAIVLMDHVLRQRAQNMED